MFSPDIQRELGYGGAIREAIRQEMDAMDEELLNYTVPSDLTTKEVLDYESLQERFGDNIPVMKLIKRSIDQNNIMNPGKIFDLN